jgi:hypothetical protein
LAYPSSGPDATIEIKMDMTTQAIRVGMPTNDAG